jgi:peptidoglycan/xylan/chitin deacetylase (PgdA/CDA1 family)
MKTVQPARMYDGLVALGLGLLLTLGCSPSATSDKQTGGNGSATGGKAGNSNGTGGKSSEPSSSGSGGSGNTGGASASGGAAGSGGTLGSGGSGAGGTSGGSGGGTASGGGSGDGGAETGGESPDGATPKGLGPWTGNDNVPPSANPPGGLKPEQVPMFISFGFDDNTFGDGVTWVATEFAKRKNPAGTGRAETYDGTSVRATFYDTSQYVAAASAWKAAYMNGHELGNHTVSHMDGRGFSEAQWDTEIKGCIDFHTGAMVGQKRDDIWGFRTPQLRYNEATFTIVDKYKFWYDCSIEEGVQTDQDATNFLWPYTLDSGSPGNVAHPNPMVARPKTWPKGLWEMPAYKVVMPPDADAAKYGVPAGLRAKMKALHPEGIGINEAKITGLDYNLWAPAAAGAYNFTKAEFVATLKYSLDQRLKGNRAPFLMGMHSFYYSSQYTEPTSTPLAERRAAVAEFLDWALAAHPDVRIVTTKAVLDWIRNPVPLR